MDPWSERMPRTVGLRRAVTVLIAITIGSGIFRVPATVAGLSSHHQAFWSESGRLSLLAIALVPVMYTYDGWVDLCFMGGEIANPQRTLPWSFRSPSVAILLTTALGIVYVLQSDFTRPDLPRPYRTYPVVPGLFVAASLGMLGGSLIDDPWDTATSFLVIASGVAIYYLRQALMTRAAGRG
jgi:amino acid transporter